MKIASKNFLLLGFMFVAMSVFAVSYASDVEGKFDFAQSNPVRFLDFLKEENTSEMYTIDEPISRWIKEEDISSLIMLLNSEEKCMSVALSASSQIRLGSTIGDEAAFLIYGFREGMYPPQLNSTHVDAMHKAEILKWWERYGNAINRQSGEMPADRFP